MDPSPTLQPNYPGDIRGFLRKCLGFILVFGVVRFALEWIVPFHTGGVEISEKISHLESEKRPVDILFLGSSRTRRSIIPGLFDTLSGRSHPNGPMSFNMGAPAAVVGENRYVLSHLAREKVGRHLQTVFVEINDIYLPYQFNRQTERARYWMDIAQFIDYLPIMAEPKGYLHALREGTYNYLAANLLHRTISLGRVGTTWMSSQPPDTTLDRWKGYKLSFGNLTNPDGKDPNGQWVNLDYRLVSRLEQEARRLHRLHITPADNETSRQWREMIDSYREKGIRIIILVLPGEMKKEVLSIVRSLPPCHVLDFSDPDRYPDLYDPILYSDIRHFNYSGSMRFTQHLAREWRRPCR
jgi:hypothetical protein